MSTFPEREFIYPTVRPVPPPAIGWPRPTRPAKSRQRALVEASLLRCPDRDRESR